MIVDSSVLIAILRGEAEAAKFRTLLAQLRLQVSPSTEKEGIPQN